MPVTTCLSNVLNEDIKTATTVHIFIFIKANVLNRLHRLNSLSERRNPWCSRLVDQQVFCEWRQVWTCFYRSGPKSFNRCYSLSLRIHKCLCVSVSHTTALPYIRVCTVSPVAGIQVTCTQITPPLISCPQVTSRLIPRFDTAVRNNTSLPPPAPLVCCWV